MSDFLTKADYGLVAKAVQHYRVNLTRTWERRGVPPRTGLLRQLWRLELHARKESQ